MVIKKVMNNSLVLATDDNDNEYIVLGKGIGFQQKAGNIIDENKIEKFSPLHGNIHIRQYMELLDSVKEEYITATKEIIDNAEKKLNISLNNQIFFLLLDHLVFAVERHKQGILLQNRLFYEIKHYYPVEFSIGMDSLKIIENTLCVEFSEFEASNIAFHIINAKSSIQDFQKNLEYMSLIKDIVKIVKFSLQIEIDEQDLNYIRFVTHLQFFVQRLLDNKMLKTDDYELFDTLKSNHPEEMQCVHKIAEHIRSTKGKEISQDEQFYLLVHIIRMRKHL